MSTKLKNVPKGLLTKLLVYFVILSTGTAFILGLSIDIIPSPLGTTPTLADTFVNVIIKLVQGATFMIGWLCVVRIIVDLFVVCTEKDPTNAEKQSPDTTV